MHQSYHFDNFGAMYTHKYFKLRGIAQKPVKLPLLACRRSLGRHPQASIQHLTVPNCTVLLIAACAGTLTYVGIQRKYFKPLWFTKK